MNKLLSGVVFALGFVGTVVASQSSPPSSSFVLPSVKRSPSDSHEAQQGTPAFFSKKPSRSLSASLSVSNNQIPGQELRTPTPSQKGSAAEEALYFGRANYPTINAYAPTVGHQAPNSSPASPYAPGTAGAVVTGYTEQIPGVVNDATSMDAKRPAPRVIAREERVTTEIAHVSKWTCCCCSKKKQQSQRVTTMIYQREGSH